MSQPTVTSVLNDARNACRVLASAEGLPPGPARDQLLAIAYDAFDDIAAAILDVSGRWVALRRSGSPPPPGTTDSG